MRKNLLVFLLALFVISLFVIGCGSDDSSEESGSKSESDETEAEAEEEEEEEAETETTSGGDLHVAIDAQPPTLDVVQTTATSARDTTQHIYEGLVVLNSKLEVEPMLAESYDISDDGKQVTFHLREGIKFHNGNEVTTEDVIASMERWQEMSSSAITFLEGTTYEADGDNTVIAHIEKPSTLDMFIFADLTQFAAIMPKEIIDAATAEGIEEFIGTGPYEFVDWKTDQYIELSRFEDYQSRTEAADGLAGEKKAIADNIFIHFVTDASTRLAGLMSGEYDIATAIPQDDVDAIDKNDSVDTEIFPSALLVAMFNKKEGPFTDKKLRQAVNAAINVEDVLIASYNKEEFYVVDHALVKEPDSPWYSEVGKDIYNTYDPELAKELLAEAGYDGEEIVLLTIRENDQLYNTSIVLEQQLNDVGINLTLNVLDTESALALTDDPSEWDIWIDAFAFRPLPVQQLFLNPDYMGWPDSPALQSIIDEVLYADTLEDAQEFTDEFHEVFWDEVMTIKFGNSTNVTGKQAGLDGFQFISGPILWNVNAPE